MRQWIDLQRITELLKSEWCWTKNVKCKYIELRIDMRDGHCLIKDRNGTEISIRDLEYQSGEKL